MSQARRIAVIPGDGVGPEVVGAARRVLERLPLELELVELEAGWETFERQGTSLPDATLEEARRCDGILFGAVSSPSRPVEGYTSPIVRLRRELDLWANLRPIRSSPVSDSHPGVDMLIVRENTEGLYSGRERLEDSGRVAIAERVISVDASQRIAERAFLEALRRAHRRDSKPRVTIAHKANVLRVSDGLFRRVCLEVAERYPEVEVEEQLIDSLIYRLWREPRRWDVIVAPNLYGDIASDAAAALVGGLGLVPSANVGDDHQLAEPVHGSAPDIAGRGVANPSATLRALAMLLELLGEGAWSEALDAAVDTVLQSGPRTPDLGGSATTDQVTDAVIDHLFDSRAEHEDSPTNQASTSKGEDHGP